jgi:hypothetical protein
MLGAYKFTAQRDGNLAEYFLVNDADFNLVRIPDALTDEQALQRHRLKLHHLGDSLVRIVERHSLRVASDDHDAAEGRLAAGSRVR